jgi:hypothetical protein
MSAGIWFWILYVISLVFSGWAVGFTGGPRVWGGSLVLFILIGLLGWRVFGAPLQ